MPHLSPEAILGLPSFLFAVTVFYWSYPIFSYAGLIPFFKFKGRRNDTFLW